MTGVIERVKRSGKQAGKSSRGDEATGDARRDRWRKHRIARRKEFVEAALRALDTHGPDLGMEDVAAEAGVTKPVLYRHFDDKADLYVALGQRGTEILFERLIPAINAELAPVPRIRMALDAFFTDWMTYEAGCSIENEYCDNPVQAWLRTSGKSMNYDSGGCALMRSASLMSASRSDVPKTSSPSS